jgi:hypothetical protein
MSFTSMSGCLLAAEGFEAPASRCQLPCKFLENVVLDDASDCRDFCRNQNIVRIKLGEGHKNPNGFSDPFRLVKFAVLPPVFRLLSKPGWPLRNRPGNLPPGRSAAAARQRHFRKSKAAVLEKIFSSQASHRVESPRGRQSRFRSPACRHFRPPDNRQNPRRYTADLAIRLPPAPPGALSPRRRRFKRDVR